MELTRTLVGQFKKCPASSFQSMAFERCDRPRFIFDMCTFPPVIQNMPMPVHSVSQTEIYGTWRLDLDLELNWDPRQRIAHPY